MAEWLRQFRSDGIVNRAYHDNEVAEFEICRRLRTTNCWNGKTKVNSYDSGRLQATVNLSTKSRDVSPKYVDEGFDDQLMERQGLVRGRYRQGQSVRPAMSLRILDEFGNINIARTHLVPIDAHDVPDGFLPT